MAQPRTKKARWQDRYLSGLLTYSKLYGCKATEAERLPRAAELVARAIDDEQNGKPNSADFHWNLAYAALPEKWWEDAEWIEFVGDALWGSHWALIRGGVTENGINSRIWTHFSRIDTLAEHLPKQAEDAKADLEWLLRKEIDLSTQAGRTGYAILLRRKLYLLCDKSPAAVEQYLIAVTDNYKERLAKAGDNAVARISILEDAARSLEMLRTDDACCYSAYGCEASVRRDLAVDMTNEMRISDGLVQIRKALTLNPNSDDIREIHDQIVERMEQIRTRAKELESEIGSGSNKVLNSHGLTIVEEARKGYSAYNIFMDSKENVDIAKQREFAFEQYLWRRFGYPSAALSSSGPQDLLKALNVVFNTTVAAEQELEAVWRNEAAAFPSLRHVDPAPAVQFLRARLFEGEDVQEISNEEVVPQRLGAGLTYPAAAQHSKSDREPFMAWWHRAQDKRVKIIGVAAAVAFVVCGLLAGRESYYRSVRNRSYLAVNTAAKTEDYRGVLDGVRRFLAAPLLTSDSREGELVSQYDAALLKWMNQNDPNDQDLRALVSGRPRRKQ